jgi:hypothetical protein
MAWLGPGDAHIRVALDFIQEAMRPGFLQGETWLSKHKMAALCSLFKNDWFLERGTFKKSLLQKKFWCGVVCTKAISWI